MHVLVVGGTRFVGYLVVWRLLAGGHRVTIFNRGTLTDPFKNRVDRLRGDRGSADFARLLRGRDFDAAVDFAAYQGAEVRDAAEVLDGRVGRYVFVSSGQVYLMREGCPAPARETDYDGAVIPRPTDPADTGQWDYGTGKRACEDVLVEAWARRRFPATRLRLPIVHGERDYARRLDPYLWPLLDGGTLQLPDGGHRPMRHVYGGDVARVVVDLLGRSDGYGEAYNIAQAETPTLRELVNVLADLLGARARVTDVSSAALLAQGVDPTQVSPLSGRWMSFLDPTRAVAELGFVATPLREYLGRIVASFLAQVPAPINLDP